MSAGARWEGGGRGDGPLPVFLFPSALTFVAAQAGSHKQLLTLYNPYDFPVEYQVLSTAPAKYSVGDPQGILRPKCCIDIVIRHTQARAAVPASAAPQTDRFRVQIWERGNRSSAGRKDVTAGRKDVTATLLARAEAAGVPSSPSVSFQGVPRAEGERGAAAGSQYAFSQRRAERRGEGGGATPLTLLGGLLCVVALSLPSEGAQATLLPAYLHLTLPQKLVAAYVLGILTMLLLRR